MTNSEIRAEITELINGGMNKVSQITSYFRKHCKDADIKEVKEEATELINEMKQYL